MGTSGWRARVERGSCSRLVRLPQHRREPNAAIGQRQGNDLLPMPAPVHVRLCSEELPAHVLEVLDAEAAESRGYLETAPRARVRGDRAVLLVGPARGTIGASYASYFS